LVCMLLLRLLLLLLFSPSFRFVFVFGFGFFIYFPIDLASPSPSPLTPETMSHHHHHHSSHRAGPTTVNLNTTVSVTLNFTDDLPNGPYITHDTLANMRLFISQKGSVLNAHDEVMRTCREVISPPGSPPWFTPWFTPCFVFGGFPLVCSAG